MMEGVGRGEERWRGNKNTEQSLLENYTSTINVKKL